MSVERRRARLHGVQVGLHQLLHLLGVVRHGQVQAVPLPGWPAGLAQVGARASATLILCKPNSVPSWAHGALGSLMHGIKGGKQGIAGGRAQRRRPHPHAQGPQKGHQHAHPSHRMRRRTRGPPHGPRAHLRRRTFCARSSARPASSAVLMSSAAARRSAQAASRSARSAFGPAAPSSAARGLSIAGAVRGCAAAGLAGGVCACGAGRAPQLSDTARDVSTLGGLQELSRDATRRGWGRAVHAL